MMEVHCSSSTSGCLIAHTLHQVVMAHIAWDGNHCGDCLMLLLLLPVVAAFACCCCLSLLCHAVAAACGGCSGTQGRPGFGPGFGPPLCSDDFCGRISASKGSRSEALAQFGF